jgi:hypothetical protein
MSAAGHEIDGEASETHPERAPDQICGQGRRAEQREGQSIAEGEGDLSRRTHRDAHALDHGLGLARDLFLIVRLEVGARDELLDKREEDRNDDAGLLQGVKGRSQRAA